MNETLKLAIRNRMHRRNIAINSDPYINRVARALEHLGVDTVLDVGANVGQYASMIRSAGFAGRIISCEPLPDAFAALERRASGDSAWTAVRTAVGRDCDDVVINVAQNSYSSSIRNMTDAHVQTDPTSAYVSTVTVPSTTVEDLVAAHGVDPSTSLLKVDTQGYESEVLAGAGQTVTQFALVQLELSWVSLYDGQALGDELTQLMRSHGFGIFGSEPGIADATTGRLLQSDVLFARE